MTSTAAGASTRKNAGLPQREWVGSRAVSKTSGVAACHEQLRHILRNDDLVEKLTASGPPFLTTAEMAHDKSTRIGFVSTISEGPDIEISAGTVLEARALTERVSVLGLLLPALEEMLRGPNRSSAI